MITLRPIETVPSAAIEALLDRAFGADRHARTAYRVRGDAKALPDLSFAAMEGETLLGSIQGWPVRLRGDDGREWPLVMVGPVAVEPGRQGEGVGRLLVTRMLDQAGPDRPLMLIGDPEYYGRFGFTADRTGGWRLPGPVEARRLLARGSAVPGVAGDLGPASASLDAERQVA